MMMDPRFRGNDGYGMPGQDAYVQGDTPHFRGADTYALADSGHMRGDEAQAGGSANNALPAGLRGNKLKFKNNRARNAANQEQDQVASSHPPANLMSNPMTNKGPGSGFRRFGYDGGSESGFNHQFGSQGRRQPAACQVNQWSACFVDGGEGDGTGAGFGVPEPCVHPAADQVPMDRWNPGLRDSGNGVDGSFARGGYQSSAGPWNQGNWH
jgi:hypothetical protein